MRNLCCLSKHFASQQFTLLPDCLLEGQVDRDGLRTFRAVNCDTPLALIIVRFLSTLLVSSPLSHSKGLCLP